MDQLAAPDHLDDDLTLVALTPADMAPAQSALATWCERKIAAVRAELQDLEANHLTLVESGMKAFALAGTIRRTAKRITYYEKIKAAVEAGYLVVPNFPIDVFAVRVKRHRQPETVSDNKWGTFDEADAQLLPCGEGRYVDEKLLYRDHSYTETVDGKSREVRRYVTAAYDDVDFPFAMVKPAVLAATSRAMALKIFDQVGTVENSVGRDPIVVGRLLDPRGNRRCVTFFVAWWLDTRTL